MIGLTKQAQWIVTIEKNLLAVKYVDIYIDFDVGLHGLVDVIVRDRDF
jgi:hypothetical protein